MTAVRSPIWPTANTAPGPVTPDRAAAGDAARKAFFDMAMGKAAGTSGPASTASAAAGQSTAPVAASVPVVVKQPAPVGNGARLLQSVAVEMPDGSRRILRPGSLLDIRV